MYTGGMGDIYIDKFGGTVLLSHRVILYPHLYLWHTLTCIPV